MATNIPPPLKTADITRFAIRAAQLEKAKPAVAYWCYYYVLDKILTKGLHKTDEQCQNYVVALMDKVEQMKNENADDDAIKDELAAKAYMEQFAVEIFVRADNAVRANKATKTTAENFQAALTFLDVLHIWPPVDQDITEKIKYAKYHAVRILKALKAGEDPNDSNPTPEPASDAPPPLDVNDPEVQAIAGLGPGSKSPGPGSINTSDETGPPQFVDEAPVSPPEAPISLPPYPNENSSASTQAMPHHTHTEEDFYQKPSQPDVSPLPPSEGGGYFPEVPNDKDVQSPVLPGPPSDPPQMAPSPISPAPPSLPQNQAPQPRAFPPSQPQPPPVGLVYRPPPSQPSVPALPLAQPSVPATTEVDDEAISSAQKHARFAISALNFEDVSTAVKELRAALADLKQI